LIEKQSLDIKRQKLAVEKDIYMVYQQTNQNNARPIQHQPNIARPTQSKQPKNVRPAQQLATRAPAPKHIAPSAPAPKQTKARAPASKQTNARAPLPKQSGHRLTIIEVIEYLNFDNWMYENDFKNIGRLLSAKYIDVHGVRPKFEFDTQYRVHGNVYFVTDRHMMEHVIVQYDNKKNGY
jgi:hypothetical protein